MLVCLASLASLCKSDWQMLASLVSPRKSAWQMSASLASPRKSAWEMLMSLASPNIFLFVGKVFHFMHKQHILYV
jgi:hypothetical protein